MVTIKEIAERVHKTEATVSMALNDKPGVSEKVREEIKRVARDMGYIPNSVARNLATNETRTIGLIVPELVNPFFSCFAEFVNRQLDDNGFKLMISVSNQSINSESRAVKDMISKRVDGLIIVPVTDEIGDIPYSVILEMSGIPYVFATAYYPKFKKSFVMTDLAEGERLVVENLLKSGHRKILMIGTNKNSPSNSYRIEGAVKACMEQNMDPAEIVSFSGIPEPTFQAAYDFLNKFIDDNEFDYSAIVTINDVMALGVMRVLDEKNVKVPEEISVIGYDNLIFSEISTVPLSTVSQNTHEIAKICVEKILSGDCRSEITVTPKLILRASSK